MRLEAKQSGLRIQAGSENIDPQRGVAKLKPPRMSAFWSKPGQHTKSQVLLRVLLIGQVAFLMTATCQTSVATGERDTNAVQVSSSQARVQEEDASPPIGAPAHQARSLKELPRQVLSDQKLLWLCPFRLKRADIPWAGAFLGTSAGLIAIDRRVGQGLSDTPPGAGYSFSRRVGQFVAPLTELGVAGTVYLEAVAKPGSDH